MRRRAGRTKGSGGSSAPTLVQVLATVINASEAERVPTQLPLVDLAIRPQASAQHSFDFRDPDAMIAAGRRAAEEALAGWDIPLPRPIQT